MTELLASQKYAIIWEAAFPAIGLPDQMLPATGGGSRVNGIAADLKLSTAGMCLFDMEWFPRVGFRLERHLDVLNLTFLPEQWDFRLLQADSDLRNLRDGALVFFHSCVES